MTDATLTVLTINARLGADACRGIDGLEAKVKASMRGVLAGNWMETGDARLFEAAIGGVLMMLPHGSQDERRLLRSLKLVGQMEAWLQATRAGLKAEPPQVDEQDVLPLIGWWHEAKEQHKPGAAWSFERE